MEVAARDARPLALGDPCEHVAAVEELVAFWLNDRLVGGSGWWSVSSRPGIRSNPYSSQARAASASSSSRYARQLFIPTQRVPTSPRRVWSVTRSLRDERFDVLCQQHGDNATYEVIRTAN